MVITRYIAAAFLINLVTRRRPRVEDWTECAQTHTQTDRQTDTQK